MPATDDGRVMTIREQDCCDCGNCLRCSDCPTGALHESPDSYLPPREVRRFFSDPTPIHTSTGVPGRGTEECKTNDVRGFVKGDRIGVLIEFGRPGRGARLSQVEPTLRDQAHRGRTIVSSNPLHELLADPAAGRLEAEYRDQLVLSVIVEYLLRVGELDDLLAGLRGTLDNCGTAAAVSVIYCPEETVEEAICSSLLDHGFSFGASAKVNVGLGHLRWSRP